MENFVWESLKDLYCNQLYPHNRLWFTVDLYDLESELSLSENGYFGETADPDEAVKMARTAMLDSELVKSGQTLRVFCFDAESGDCLCEVKEFVRP